MLRWNSAGLATCAALLGCVHTLEIRNPAPVPLRVAQQSVPPVIGVTRGTTPEESRRYVDVVAEALRSHGVASQVVYPAEPGHKVDYLAAVTVSPEYLGSGWNFLVNFPGFLVWAPAWNGYIYEANPRTHIELTKGDGSPVATIDWEHAYEFRQADIGRTWTEISWFEWGVIALVSGVVFTRYDIDQTPVFIEQVAPNYGEAIATLVANRLAGPLQAGPPPAGQ